jgi:hypothetical protein
MRRLVIVVGYWLSVASNQPSTINHNQITDKANILARGVKT